MAKKSLAANLGHPTIASEMSVSDEEYEEEERKSWAHRRDSEAHYRWKKRIHDRLTDTEPKPRKESLLGSDGSYLYVYGGHNVSARYIWRYNLLTGQWKILNPKGTNRDIHYASNDAGGGAQCFSSGLFAPVIFLDFESYLYYGEEYHDECIRFHVTRQMEPYGTFERSPTDAATPTGDYENDMYFTNYPSMLYMELFTDHNSPWPRFFTRHTGTHFMSEIRYDETQNKWSLNLLTPSMNYGDYWESLPENIREFMNESEGKCFVYNERIFHFQQCSRWGFARILTFDLQTRKFGIESVNPDPKFGFPSSRSTRYAASGKFIYMTGGDRHPYDFRDVWRFDMEVWRWTKLGHLPEKVMLHSAIVVNEFLYVFGGHYYRGLAPGASVADFCRGSADVI